MQPGRTTNTGGGTMEVKAAAPRCQLLLILLMSVVMLLPGTNGSLLLVQRTVTRTIVLQETIGKVPKKRTRTLVFESVEWVIDSVYLGGLLQEQAGDSVGSSVHPSIFSRVVYFVDWISLVKIDATMESAKAFKGCARDAGQVDTQQDKIFKLTERLGTKLSLEVPPPLMFPMTVTPLGRDQDCSLKNREPDVPPLGSWILEVGARPPRLAVLHLPWNLYPVPYFIISPLMASIAFCFELELMGLRTVAPHTGMLFQDAPEHMMNIYGPKRKNNHHNFPLRPSSESWDSYRQSVDIFKMINKTPSV
ncbi:hypothetical protein STEG23_021439 [Scotinomys teguina]